MAIPKKRKKLEDDSNLQSELKQDINTEYSFQENNPPNSLEKIDDTIENAFDVVNLIDLKLQSPEEKRTQKNNRENTGLHISIQLDPLNFDELLVPESKIKSDKKNIVDIQLSLPYIWNLPIIHDVTKNIIQNLKQFKIL